MKNILVLGINTTEHDVFGGIVDIDMPNPTVDESILLDAINTALLEKENNPELICGTAELDFQPDCYNMTKKLPFNGKIDAEVIIYA